jgi:hypothetical protein
MADGLFDLIIPCRGVTNFALDAPNEIYIHLYVLFV